MKRIFTYTFIVILAALVFYGGAGVNVISFCCDDCRNAGTQVVKEGVCCEIHGHSHGEMAMLETADASVSHTEEMCCNLRRVYFDWNDGHTQIISPSPVVLDLLFTGIPDISINPLPIVREINTVMPTGPPLCPKVYLSLLTTLLI